MDHAHAHRPRGDREVGRPARTALRAVSTNAPVGPGAASPEERTGHQPSAPAAGEGQLVLPSERRRRLEHFAAIYGPRPGEAEPGPQRPADLRDGAAEGERRFEPAATPQDARPPAATGAPAPRRTVEITGRPGPSRTRGRRRPSRSARNGPDRLALWAVVMGIFLALVAATTARGDEAPSPGPPPPAADVVR